MKNRILTTALIIFIISATFGGAMFGLNFITGPMIEANNAGAEFAPLLAVMPEGAEFDGEALIYDSENPSASALKNVPTSVLSVYQEKNGLGFAIRATATSGYTTSPLVMTIGVTADGKICGIQIDNYGDEAGSNWNKTILTNDYINKYIGQDSTLADVELIANPTSDKASSVAFKNGVAAALDALIVNDLITAGVATDAKILKDLIPTVAPSLKMNEAVEASGNITEAYKALNNSGFAYIMTEGEASYLAVVNAMGVCKLYNVEGAEVSAEHEDLVAEAKAHANENQTPYIDDLTTKIGNIIANAENITRVELDTFSNVVAATTFQIEGATYYAFYSTPLNSGKYGTYVMSIVTVINEDGAIVKQDIESILYGENGLEYVPAYEEGYGDSTSDVYNQYEEKFEGLTSGGITDDLLISSATISSTAIKTATADAFAAFESIISNEGGEQ